ncbi:MAG: Phosphoenolpyruvate carboxykinase (ATP) [Firmicutes bacterium]|nr:Phosphoenolpyruvate carboxykinase (ATP) [Bacillota bacterium]
MRTTENVYRNLTIPELIEQSLKRGEGVLTATGALAVNTGKYTGRSPEDRFIVDEPEVHDEIDWGKVNRPFSPERFAALHNKLLGYFSGRAAFVCDGLVGADPDRRLIGDDEHGWSEHGVVLDEHTRHPDYNDDSITENTRACYPVEFIPNAVLAGQGGLPQTIVFLTADAFGVLPPVARLSREQAMYHFISGYTSKLAGTERWTGGDHGSGKRISIAYTRAIITAILSGDLDKCSYQPDRSSAHNKAQVLSLAKRDSTCFVLACRSPEQTGTRSRRGPQAKTCGGAGCD